MSDQSNFSDKEIEQQQRQATSKRANLDYDQLQAKRDLLAAVRTDSPEEFQARMAAYGIDLNSERGKTIVGAYWAIRRHQQR